jgi:hypothetical protein
VFGGCLAAAIACLCLGMRSDFSAAPALAGLNAITTACSDATVSGV